jgi:hypothetical protein
MIRKSGSRFSEKIMLKQQSKVRFQPPAAIAALDASLPLGKAARAARTQVAHIPPRRATRQ